MERLLINMAIVKVNWDRSGADLLENYIPLLAHVLWECEGATISLQELKSFFRDTAEFDIPIAALGTLVKRAIKKHGFLTRSYDGTFQIRRDKLPEQRYREIRDGELRKYKALRNTFIDYCTSINIAPPTTEEVDSYFFDVLYDVAPSLVTSTQKSSVADAPAASREPESVRALVARFIASCYDGDPVSTDAIESFVRGAMLTETFYYSAPDTLTQRMRDVTVYLDTAFLLRALGFCEKGLAEPCIELTQILRGMSVKMRCFRDTYNEIHRILHAAATQLKGRRRLMPKNPGDIFDFYNSIGATQSDVELDIAMLERSLRMIGVTVVDRPSHVKELTIDESKLSQYIDEYMAGQTAEARKHDIDCLTAIFRLRAGRPQLCLESCIAIFVTTNVDLARASTKYFNENEQFSNAPVCMSDQVFTTLVWLKSVKKLPTLPRNRLVANCIAATQPSDRLWNEYLTEANSLRERKQISEDDYAVLVHSLEARHHLMDFVIEQGEFVHGSVTEVLDRARATYTQELSDQLLAVERSANIQKHKLESLIQAFSSYVSGAARLMLLVLWCTLIVAGLFVTAPTPFNLDTVLTLDAGLFGLMAFVGMLNLVWGVRLYDWCNHVALRLGASIERGLRRLLVA